MAKPKKTTNSWKKFELDFDQNVKFEEIKLHFERREGKRLKIDDTFDRMLTLCYEQVMEEKMREFKKTGS